MIPIVRKLTTYAMYEGHPHSKWCPRPTSSAAHDRTYVSTFRMSSVPAIAKTPSANVSSRPVSTVHRGYREPPLRAPCPPGYIGVSYPAAEEVWMIEPIVLFGIQFTLSLVVYSLIARWFVAPRLSRLPLELALAPLLWVHVFRIVGGTILAPGTVGPGVPME